jgi:hypothetical protein
MWFRSEVRRSRADARGLRLGFRIKRERARTVQCPDAAPNRVEDRQGRCPISIDLIRAVFPHPKGVKSISPGQRPICVNLKSIV